MASPHVFSIHHKEPQCPDLLETSGNLNRVNADSRSQLAGDRLLVRSRIHLGCQNQGRTEVSLSELISSSYLHSIPFDR